MNEEKKDFTYSGKPERTNFALDKIKLLKDAGGLDVVYKETVKDGPATYVNEVHKKVCISVHPDLANKVSELIPCLAHVYHMTAFRNMVLADEFKATKKQQEIAESAYQEILAKIKVSGFALSGQDENIGIIITGTFRADNNMVMAINSHRMKFSGTTYGFEEDIEEIVSEIEEEVYEYLFENKKAQLDLFDSNLSEEEQEEIFPENEDEDEDPDLFPDMEDPADENNTF